jgi:alpha-galactosidase
MMASALLLAPNPTDRELAQAHVWAAAHFNPPGAAAPAAGLLVRANHGSVQADGRGTGPLTLGKKTYAHGLYCHAPSSIEVHLPEPGRTFTATVGVDTNNQTSPGRGSVVFTVKVAGKEVFTSGLVREGMAPVDVHVDLGGASSFTLEIGDGGDGISCDQSDWAEAKITLADGRELWLSDLPFLEDAAGLPPFSFTYGGKLSSALLPTWTRHDESKPLDANRTQRVITWHDPASGLEVACIAVEYNDYPVVEWTVHFRNTGAAAGPQGRPADTPILEALQGLDLSLKQETGEVFTLHCTKGDSCTPDSYEPFDLPLDRDHPHTFAAAGGRPTNGSYPYYNLQLGGRGMIVAVGWPGQWASSFAYDADGRLRVQAGQELTHLVLHPGEEVRTPLIATLLWQGTDVARAQNLWRRWMLAHNQPRPDPKPLAPIYCFCDGAFYPGLKCDEKGEIHSLDVLRRERIKLDFWWMDAGWYPCTNDWADGVGTWDPDPVRFPRGLKPISDHAHAMGAGLILWLEPERVMPGTWLYKNHPEWLLGHDGEMKLFNLGNPAAREWLTDHVDKLIREQGIDLYRQDFNLDPLGFWRANDAPDRQGMTENLHVQGYLAYWDELRRRHPGMLIDSCASGGRRNDLETLRRAVPLLRSDYQSFSGDSSYDSGNQGHTYGLSPWVPYYGTGVYMSDDHLVYSVRSYMCPAFGIAVDPRRKDVDWDTYRRLVEQWREVVGYMLGDYYPLTSYSLDDGTWMAWQFHLADQDRGIVQVFRHAQSPYETAAFPLHGLDPAATYEISDLDTKAVTKVSGHDLMGKGLRLTVTDKPGAAVFFYRRTR